MAKEYDYMEEFQKLLGSPIKNICVSFFDDFIQANAEFRTRAGLKEYIIRTELSRGCKWCHNLAGVYEYTPTMDTKVFMKHDNCKCLVTHSTEKGIFKDVWTKKEFLTLSEARINRLAEAEKEIAARKLIVIDTEFYEMYNKSPGQIGYLSRLENVYKEDVESGWISPLSGFLNYVNLFESARKDLIGIKTKEGIEVKSISRHFMQRVIGTGTDPDKVKAKAKITSRSGVKLDDVRDTLLTGRIRKKTQSAKGTSVTYSGKKCAVSINEETGNLIQCNPL